MRHAISRSVKSLLRASGHYRRKLVDEQFPGVAVLCYHAVRRSPSDDMAFRELHVSADELAAHCRFVAENCHPISFDDWLAADQQMRPLPQRPVMFTFDDGYRSVLTSAKDVLERYRIPALVFVSSEPVRKRQMFWHDAVAEAENADVVEQWKQLPYDEWRARVRSVLDVSPCDERSPYAPLSIDEVKRLANHDLFELGGHTRSHAVLANASLDAQRHEIESNRSDLEGWTGETLRAFAYPNGRPALDYSEDTTRLVRETGYQAAFTTKHGFATSTEPALARSRFFMLAGVTASELGHRLSYSWRRLATATK